MLTILRISLSRFYDGMHPALVSFNPRRTLYPACITKPNLTELACLKNSPSPGPSFRRSVASLKSDRCMIPRDGVGVFADGADQTSENEFHRFAFDSIRFDSNFRESQPHFLLKRYFRARHHARAGYSLYGNLPCVYPLHSSLPHRISTTILHRSASPWTSTRKPAQRRATPLFKTCRA